MVIVMRKSASAEEIAGIVERVTKVGFDVHLSEGVERTVIGLVGGDRKALADLDLASAPGVEQVTPISAPYKLASREFRQENTVIQIGSHTVGGNDLWVVGGPCSVEGRELLLESAAMVREQGAHALRAGAFKPRTSPYSFQGMGEEGLKVMAEARAQFGLPLVTEVMDTQDVELVAAYADVLQIGTRNSQNFSLLKEVGRSNKPVLLKRGMSMTIEEWLMSAEYIMSEGNPNVILCERGIRTFETATRNTLDLSAVVVAKQKTHLPVVVDPSHGVGKRGYVVAMARAAVACGADGLLVEVHQRPDEAKSDAAQTISPAMFAQMMAECGQIAEVLGRRIPQSVYANA